jgi:hypothetical protein
MYAKNKLNTMLINNLFAKMNNITKADFNEIRTYKNPSIIIEKTYIYFLYIFDVINKP